jgi:transcription-repair coupling factor (superfamily II helicase)
VQPTAFLSLYTHHPWIKQLAKDIQQHPPATFHIKGLAGSLPAVLGAALNQILSIPQLFIVQDKTEAAYLYTDLKNLLPDQSILFYSALSSGKAKSSDQSAACMQNAVLQQLCEPTDHPPLLITYLEALFQPTINPSVLQQQSVSIISQEPIVLAELVKKLTAWGFETVDFVEHAGQFATRGGIIDIFSYAHPLPYRLELAGCHIESIRTFDPLTQRSIQKIEKMVLLPSLQPAESTELVSLLDYLPTGSLIWSKDYAYLEDVQTEPLTAQFEKSQQKDRIPTDDQATFRNLLKERVKKFVCIAYGHHAYESATGFIDYPSKPQPEFHQQFDLLIREFEKNQAAGLHIFIASSSPSQLDRLSQLIHQSNESLTFQTIELALSQGYTDIPLGMACYTDHQIFGRHHRYQSPQPYIQQRGFSLKELNSLQPGDYVVHIDYGIARFSGLSKVAFHGKEQEVVRLLYKGNDVLYVNLHALHKIAKYTGKEGTIPTINKLGSPAWELKKKKVKNKVQDMAKQLIQLYSKRKYAQGFAFSKDTPQQIALEASFMYEDTPDQAAATADVKKDMEVPYPMDRLICGDTGFGKTEVAIRAAFKAVQDQKQVAVLVPTTILALQHYETFTKRLGAFPITIAYINRFKSQAAINKIRQDSNNGKIDILIGTHKIINKDFTFKDLGLLIIDEEQKFGVKT